MRLHEYQAKDILRKAGIKTPRGVTASSPSEAGEAFSEIGAPIAVVKAQILAGGRGKVGGVKAVHSPEEAQYAASQMIGRRLFTAQSGHEGLVVRKVLVEEGLTVEKEFYLGIAIDRECARPVIIASAAGGMDIEEISRKEPEKVLREYIEPVFGLQPYQARKLAYEVGAGPDNINKFVDILLKLHIVFLVSDLELIEINPLVLVESDELIALDAKMVVDDNAFFRHEDLTKLADISDMNPLEYEAKSAGLKYIKLQGSIGCMVNGAGLAMATMDMIKACGGEPANFLDVGGGAAAGKIKRALGILLSDKQVEAVLINIFGGILRCDELAKGIVAAASELSVSVPMVARLEGTNSLEGAEILRKSGLNISFAGSMREAGELAVASIKSNA
ncbi:MAG: ADP-forming succinate--CoA ligase subunit beta [Nitrospirota bacterium]